MATLKQLIDSADIGGVAGAAKILSISPRAIYKWFKSNRLPRTDFTGETDYAGRLSLASKNKYSKKEFLDPSLIDMTAEAA